MNHMKNHWLEEMKEIKKVVTSGDEKVLSAHVLDMLKERGMSVVDLALVLNTGEIILGLDENEDCPEAYVKNVPGIHRLVLGKNSKRENVVVSMEVGYKGSLLVVEKIITIYSLDEEINPNDKRRYRKLQIRKFLKTLVSVNHDIFDDKFRDEQGRRVYFEESGCPYVIGKDGRVLKKFKGYKTWAFRKTS